MHLFIEANRLNVYSDLYVMVRGLGHAPDDTFLAAAVGDDSDLSALLYEAHALGHSFWRHGLVGVECYGPKMFEWRMH